MTSLRKGQKVSITFEGVVHDAAERSVTFEPQEGQPVIRSGVVWSASDKPVVHVLDHGYRNGDLAVFTSLNCDGDGVCLVVYRTADVEGKRSAEGWYRTTDNKFMAYPEYSSVRLLAHADGTVLGECAPDSEPKSDPEVPSWVPQDSDIGVYGSPAANLRTPVVFRRFNNRGSAGWYSVATGNLIASADSLAVELVMRASGEVVGRD